MNLTLIQKTMTKKLTFLGVFLIGFVFFIGLAYASTYLNVSLSPNTPQGGYISATSTNVAFTSFDLQNTASSTENIIVDKLVIYNTGTSAATPRIFGNLYLYDQENLIATSTNRIYNYYVFNGFELVVPTSTIKTLTIKGDLGPGALTGQTIVIGLENNERIRGWDQSTYQVSSTPAFVSGNYPINGNTFTIL